MKKRNLRNLLESEKKYFNFSLDEITSYGCIDNGTLPIMKFKFYRNGKIKNFFKPKNLTVLLYNNMINVLEKVIPKISEDYFNISLYNNISEAIKTEYEKINNNSLEKEEDDKKESKDNSEKEYENEREAQDLDNFKENEFEEEHEERRNRILFKKNEQKSSRKVKIIKFNKRKMQGNNMNETNNTYSYDDIDETIEQEFNKENEFNLNIFNNKITEGPESTTNNTNLNFYSHSAVRNDYAEFKGSQQNTTINSIIDENEKSLKEVHYSHQGRLVDDGEFKDEIEQDKMNSCSNENMIDCNDLVNDTDENIVNSEINSMDYEIIEDVFSTGTFIDKNKKTISK